jgi:PAS domain S-box-containing protein
MLNATFFGLSHRVKLTAVGLGLVMVALLAWVFTRGKELNDDITILLHDSQQVSVQQLASHIGDGVDYRLQALEVVAQKMAEPMQKGVAATQHYADHLPLSTKLFNGGLVVYNHNGVVVAQGLGAQALDTNNVFALAETAHTLQHAHSVVGPPEIHALTGAPILAMFAPIKNARGEWLGMVQGLTVLTEPNFLDRIVAPYLIEGEQFLLLDPVRRLVVYATDKNRIFEQLPLRGVNAEWDGLLSTAGLPEAFAVPSPSHNATNSYPVRNGSWILVSAPEQKRSLLHLNTRQTVLWLTMVLLAVISGWGMAWFYRRSWLPVERARTTLARQLQGKKRWMDPAPVARSHEVGEIIGSVNQLLSTLGQADVVLPQIDYFAKSLADNMPDVVGYWTSDLRCSYANGGYLQWFGRTPEQMHGAHMKTVLGETVFAQNEPYIQAVLRGENQQFERHFVQPNGRRRDAWVQYLVHKVQGEVQGFFVFMVDITQVKSRESVARMSDAALKAMSQGIFIADAKHNILLVNDAFTRITGYEKSEALGRSYQFLHGVLTDTLVQEVMARTLREGQSFSGEVMHYRKDGSTFWDDLTISPVCNDQGQVTHYTGVVRDVTARKHLEDERLRAKMLLERDVLNRSILHSLPWDLAVINRQGQVLALNHPHLVNVQAGMVEDPLFPREEGHRFLSVAASGASRFVEPYRQRAKTGLRAVLSADTELFQMEYPVSERSDARWSSMIITPLGDDRQGAIVARQDITDLKRTHFALQDATTAAEKANHAKSHFLATASHDLRQPLSALSLYVGLLNKRIDFEQKELAENIRGCVESLSELLDDLLDVSKLDAGVVQPRLADCAVDDLLASQIAIHAVNAQRKGLQLRLRPSGAVVHADPQLLQRIVGNLVTNAIRYTHQGGVLLACRQRQGDYWLQVWDTGEGIPEDKHELIFEEFQQLHQHERVRGSGLGLAIVAKIAKLLNLEVVLRSRPGRGSVFAVKLPAAKNTAIPTASAVLQAQAPPSLRMAVIDDDVCVLRAMTMALEGAGHEVVAASDAADLLAQLGTLPPQIIVSDYRLQHGRTGFEAIESVRTHFHQPDLPAIVVTGDTDPALIRSMAEQGIAVHFKPLKLEILQAFVKETLDRCVV